MIKFIFRVAGIKLYNGIVKSDNDSPVRGKFGMDAEHAQAKMVGRLLRIGRRTCLDVHRHKT